MRTFIFLITLISMITAGTGMQAQTPDTNKKSIIVYYSRRGNNYLNGNIVDLKVGNTEVVAGKIQALTGSDIFRIETVKPYPSDYTQTTEVAKAELQSNACPELTEKVENMQQYKVIYLGYPNWWGTMPMAVCTFLESYDFNGKIIIPFCTHEGSGLGGSVQDIQKLCPEATVLIRNGHPWRQRKQSR
ncbi:MAG: flavodoxin family protein [Tannerellaceae bacterium]|nr:flavodoxin family protein [Tannerellaceae bacterium]MCD8264542.1 flavodoxin family protein [Tannerellaceae bacterium]